MIRQQEVDQLFKSNAFLLAAKENGGISYEDGGTYISQPIQVEDHSSSTQMTTGYEALDLGVNSIYKDAKYEYAYYQQPILISGKEERLNSGERAIIKILDGKVKNVMRHLKTDINKQILAGGQARFSDLNSLNGVASTTGFLENVATGSQTNTVGGIDKALYQDTYGWQNQRATIGGAFSTDGLAALDQVYADVAGVGLGMAQAVIASKAGFRNYKRAIQANERYISQKSLDAGVMSLAFAGSKMILDIDMPTNNGVGTDEFTFYLLNFEGIKLCIHKDADFSMTDFESFPGYDIRGARLELMAQLTASHLGSQAVIVDGDTW